MVDNAIMEHNQSPTRIIEKNRSKSSLVSQFCEESGIMEPEGTSI